MTAHPDDIEACAGGTISQMVSLGIQVQYVILTNGDKGCGNPSLCNDSVTAEEIAVMRAREAVNAAAVLGVTADHVTLLDYEDAMLSSYQDPEIRQRLVAVLRQIKPVATFIWWPYPELSLAPSAGWFDLGFHPDHQASARVALEANFDSGVGRLWPELGASWSIPRLYLFDFVHPTHYVDIASSIDLKAKSYEAHESQVPDGSWVLPFVTNIATMVANTSTILAAGQTNLKLAEGFYAYY